MEFAGLAAAAVYQDERSRISLACGLTRQQCDREAPLAHRVLVVDDDLHIREVICVSLKKAGMTVFEARDGTEALTRFKADQPDLIVLDIGMPELDGLEVCRQIRKSSDVPILFPSARDDEIDRILGLEIGGDDYVTKPFSPRELVARVNVILRRASSRAKQLGIHGTGARAFIARPNGACGDLRRSPAQPDRHRVWDFKGIPDATDRGVQSRTDHDGRLPDEHSGFRPHQRQSRPQYQGETRRRRLRQCH
jgi:CheY-like chemotaxis protein